MMHVRPRRPLETRAILMSRLQVPDGKDALLRAADLVKPGGWLLVEDPDDDNMVDGGKPLGPGMTAFVQAWMRILRGRGAEPNFGRHLERILNDSGAFSEVYAQKVTIPISGKTDGECEASGPSIIEFADAMCVC